MICRRIKFLEAAINGQFRVSEGIPTDAHLYPKLASTQEGVTKRVERGG